MWITKDGEEVVDRHNSHLHASVIALLPEAIAKIGTKERNFLVEVVDFGHIIGETTCVTTTSEDEVVYAQRPKRFGLTRFVKDRLPEPCSTVVLILKVADGQPGYVLVTAFIGGKPEPEPWDRNATTKSREFWSNNGLVWGSEPVIPGTETSECPW